MSGDCGFMAANLYARSIFGEDALANLSIEKPVHPREAPVVGHIRIRAKSQVIVLTENILSCTVQMSYFGAPGLCLHFIYLYFREWL